MLYLYYGSYISESRGLERLTSGEGVFFLKSDDHKMLHNLFSANELNFQIFRLGGNRFRLRLEINE